MQINASQYKSMQVDVLNKTQVEGKFETCFCLHRVASTFDQD